jgi:osmoprotectant transport system permease protein
MSYLLNQPTLVLDLLLEHLKMAGIGLFLSTLVAVPVGILINRYHWLSTPIMGTLGIFYTIPSLALIILLVPVFGLNETSVIVALTVYAQVILVRNVVAGLNGIDPAIIEAALGMGMSRWLCWWRIELPLALPVMLAGIRIAAIVTIGIAAIGAKFGAGGLGRLLFEGIAQNRNDKIWAGALVLAALAMVTNFVLQTLEWVFNPKTKIRRAARSQRTESTVVSLG